MSEVQQLKDEIYRLRCELATAKQKITWLSLGYNHPQFSFVTNQDRADNEYRCNNFGYSTGELQDKWHDPKRIPHEFNFQEAEAALLDAFISGGAHVWSGDGSSMATQIIQAVWEKRESDYCKPLISNS